VSAYHGIHRVPHLCLTCRLGLCRIPTWAIRAACVVVLAVDLYGAHKFGAF